MNVEANSSVETHIGGRAALGMDDPTSAADAGGGAVAGVPELCARDAQRCGCHSSLWQSGDKHEADARLGVCGHLRIFTRRHHVRRRAATCCVCTQVCAREE